MTWGQLGHLVDFRDSQESQERISNRNRGQGVGAAGSGGAKGEGEVWAVPLYTCLLWPGLLTS